MIIKTMFRKTILVIAVLCLTTSANAEWIDDWIQQKTYSGPSNFESQKRNFFSLGSASLRWKHGVDHPITIQKPFIKAGCGGIDMFLGGMSFMDADYLVDKFESMISAAPAIAFQIALKTLSEQLATTLTEVTAIVDRLNQLQFDDCKSAQALVTTGIDSYKAGQLQTEALADYADSSGLTDLYKSFKDDTGGQTTDVAANTVGGSFADMVSGCPALLKDIFFTDGYLLDHIAAYKNYSMDFTKLMRGFLGDIKVDVTATGIDYHFFEACNNSKVDIIDLFLDNGLEYRDGGDNCVQFANITVGGVVYNSLNDWIFESLFNIIQNTANQNPLTPGQITLLNTIPFPFKNAIDNELIFYGDNNPATFTQIASTYSRIVGVSYAFAIIKDFYAQIHETLIMAAGVTKNQTTGTQQNCQVELARLPSDMLKDMKTDLIGYIRIAQNNYSAQLRDIVNNLEITQQVFRSTKIVNDMLNSRIGNPSLFKRVSK